MVSNSICTAAESFLHGQKYFKDKKACFEKNFLKCLDCLRDCKPKIKLSNLHFNIIIIIRASYCQ